MSVRIVLHLRGVDLPAEAVVTLAEDVARDPAAGRLDRNRGVDTLTVLAADEAGAVTAVRAAVDKLREHVAGAWVQRVAPGIVSVPEISALTGIDREVVRRWTKRPDFPPLFDNLRGHKMWLWREIIDWVEAEADIRLEHRPPVAHLERELSAALGLGEASTTRQGLWGAGR